MANAQERAWLSQFIIIIYYILDDHGQLSWSSLWEKLLAYPNFVRSYKHHVDIHDLHGVHEVMCESLYYCVMVSTQMLKSHRVYPTVLDLNLLGRRGAIVLSLTLTI